MRAEHYQRITAWFSTRPRAKKLLLAAARGSVALEYAIYLGLLAAFAWARDPRFWRVLLVPAFVFATGTALRAGINRPRPYEKLAFTPLTPKNTRGKSMPSRHVFSAACIAAAAWYAAPALGAAAALLALCVGVSRVLEGVHWPGDVLAGFAYGGLLGAIGFWLV